MTDCLELLADCYRRIGAENAASVTWQHALDTYGRLTGVDGPATERLRTKLDQIAGQPTS